ncbi:hypothetical protein HAX54_036261 [Datura stramonium]|uniref:Uncharacterized protein n=1 Tax=Datura stramonium TaxID=4076 RepID=A0ABS8VHV4_DATST|nr:hypothetical protein [Datura stramonium]
MNINNISCTGVSSHLISSFLVYFGVLIKTYFSAVVSGAGFKLYSALVVEYLRKTESKVKFLGKDNDKPEIPKIIIEDSANEMEVDISEGMALKYLVFHLPRRSGPLCLTCILMIKYLIVDAISRDYSFKIKVLSKEYQHTCKSTGLMLWESARLWLLCLLTRPLFQGEVFELGDAGICSMVATRSANLCGTDVTYIADVISPCLQLQRADPILQTRQEGSTPALTCHVLRRVDEPSILSAASEFASGLNLEKLCDLHSVKGEIVPEAGIKSSSVLVIGAAFKASSIESYASC